MDKPVCTGLAEGVFPRIRVVCKRLKKTELHAAHPLLRGSHADIIIKHCV